MTCDHQFVKREDLLARCVLCGLARTFNTPRELVELLAKQRAVKPRMPKARTKG